MEGKLFTFRMTYHISLKQSTVGKADGKMEFLNLKERNT